MSQAYRRCILVSLMALILTFPGFFARAADDGWAPPSDRPGPQVEIFFSSLFANSVSEGSFGLRGSFHLRKRFALEGSLSRIADSRVNIWIADMSAKYYLDHRGRARVYLVGGPVLFFSDDLDAGEFMLHLGLGAEFALGSKFYLRPELRGRWLAENVDANFGDLALGFGWRF